MPFLTGLGLGLSLIVAIGAQNAFVLRQGVRRQHVLAVVLVCAISDAILISLGVAGIGWVLHTAPWLVELIRWLGVAFLVCYAVLAFKRAATPSSVGLAETQAPAAAPGGSAQTSTAGGVRTATRTGLLATVLTTAAITWLNPHVYLDTLVMLGSIAQAQGEAKWLFAAGAATGSVLWFFSLGYGARYLGRWLSTPRAWRILDGCIGVIMLAIAATLAFGH